MKDKDIKEIVDVLYDVISHFNWVISDEAEENVINRVRYLIAKHEK